MGREQRLKTFLPLRWSGKASEAKHLHHLLEEVISMTERFPIHSPETAPEASKPFLERTQKSFSMIPNLEGVMAAAPATGAIAVLCQPRGGIRSNFFNSG
jgi:hypothetical protein